MRRRGFIAAAALFSGCARRNVDAGGERAQAATAKPVRIVALGDSLAFGTGASSPARGFIFRAYVRVRAERPGSRIDNYAIGGSTAEDVLRLQVPRLHGVPADAVIVCVGGNDVVRRVAPSSFAATYAEIVARVAALVPRAALVLCGVPDVGLSPLFTGADQAAMARLSRDDDDAVRTLAREHHASFADLYTATRAANGDVDHFLSDDRFHPSDLGYERLADVLTPVLQRALERRT